MTARSLAEPGGAVGLGLLPAVVSALIRSANGGSESLVIALAVAFVLAGGSALAGSLFCFALARRWHSTRQDLPRRIPIVDTP